MKKRNKVSAEFNMSSLTDIIFLLLIFFMLTSAAIQVNMPLPQSDSRTVAPTDIAVLITKDNVYKFNNRVVQKREIKSLVREAKSKSENSDKATINIIAESGVAWKKTWEIAEIASDLQMRAIISTQPRN